RPSMGFINSCCVLRTVTMDVGININVLPNFFFSRCTLYPFDNLFGMRPNDWTNSLAPPFPVSNVSKPLHIRKHLRILKNLQPFLLSRGTVLLFQNTYLLVNLLL